MIAVFVNCATVIIGSLIGIFFSKKISEKMTDVIQTACGLISFVMGIQMAFKYQNVVYLALALIIGGVLGTALDIDGKILAFGKFLGRTLKIDGTTDKFESCDGKINDVSGIQSQNLRSKKNFAYAFLNASVLFCVGSMAIVGSFKAGIEHDYSLIFLKSILDGFIAIGFASAMGVGTAFSALAILIYQGALTLLSVLINDYVTPEMLAEVTGSGGVLVVMIGLNLVKIREIKTANYLPAIFLSVLFVLLNPFFIKISEFFKF